MSSENACGHLCLRNSIWNTPSVPNCLSYIKSHAIVRLKNKILPCIILWIPLHQIEELTKYLSLCIEIQKNYAQKYFNFFFSKNCTSFRGGQSIWDRGGRCLIESLDALRIRMLMRCSEMVEVWACLDIEFPLTESDNFCLNGLLSEFKSVILAYE